MNSFFVFSSELILNRILIVSIVVNKIFSFFKKILLLLLLLLLFSCVFIHLPLFGVLLMLKCFSFGCLLVWFSFPFLIYQWGQNMEYSFKKKVAAAATEYCARAQVECYPNQSRWKNLLENNRIFNNSMCNRFNLRHPHNASGVKGSLFLLHTIYCTCTHLAC